jgi:TP901 family phage tail tape measure protein
MDLVGCLHQSRSKKQINSDIREIEKVINTLRLTGVFAKGNTKKELNAYIAQLSNQLSAIKLKAKIDSKNLKSEVDKALNNVSFKDIDALDLDENKTKLKVKKVIADAKTYVEKNPIALSINVESKKSKLDNDLTSYLNKNTKISESSVLLQEADEVRNLINAINDKKSLREATDAFQLFKSEVAATGFASKSTADRIKGMLSNITKIGSVFGVVSLAINNFTKSISTLKEIDDILTEISKTSDLTAGQLEKLGDTAFKAASKYGKTASDYLLGIQEMSRSGFYGEKGTAMAEQSLLAQAAGDMSADVANNYILATNAAYKYNGEVEKLNAVLDGQNSITNRNSVSMSDMATAMSKAGTVASSYRVSVEDLSAMIGTIEAVTKAEGGEVGNGIKSILINLQNITSSKITDTLNAANASMTEFVNGTEKLRDPISIIRDLAKTFNQLDENDALRAKILTNIGGKHQATKLAALLQNMELFDKMLVDYSQGSGSAMEEAMKSANNWSGKLNQLQNSWDSLVNSMANKNAVLGGISFFDRLIQGAEGLLDTIGEIPMALTTINTALVATNKNYGITQIWDKENKRVDVEGNIFGIDISNIKAQSKHFSEAKEAIQLWNDTIQSGESDLESFISQFVKSNAQFKAYLETTSKDAPASLSGYKKYLESTGQATDALRLKTILLNSAITMGIGIAIQLAVTAIDDYIHRLDNAKEALSTTQSELSSVGKEIEDTTDKIKELEALDPSSLSITDKEDLQRLKDQNEELRIRQQYLEQQEKYDLRKVADLTKEKYNQKYGNTDNDTIDQYRALYGKKQMQPALFYLRGASAAYNTPYAPAELKGVTRESEALANLIAQYEYYSEAKKNAVQNKNTEEIEKYNGKLEELAQKLRDDRTELQGFSDDLTATGETSPELDDIASKLKLIDELLLSPGQNLVNLINSEGMSETKQRLIDLANAGKLTQDALSANFSEVDEYLKQNGLTLEDLISVVRTYKEELSDIPDTAESFSFPAYEDQINDIKSSLSTLRSALDAFNTGTLDESTVLDLMQEFPELTPYIDLAADGFGNLSEGLSVLLAQQPASLIQSLQELKDSLNTDAEREQVDLLINSLQSLSSYGDSGIEAYATTIGSTWNDTANVIEGVTSQFENLAKVQEAVADGLTMSMDAAAELAAMYPEILTNAEYAGNGQITLNEEVVKSILAGDKSIVDAQITKLEADKATLEAKKSYAEAQLEMIRQVAEGEGNITKEVAQYRLDIANALLTALIEAGMEEDRAYAAVAANMAGNMDEYNRIVGEVAKDTSVNMDRAAVSMANSININAINAQKSFEAMQQSVWSLADSIKAAANGERSGSTITPSGGGSTSGKGIVTDIHSGDFGTTLTEYTPKSIDFDEFESQLQIDISAYQKAISNIDAQIEILKNLQATFDKTSSSANGGIGGHDYRDKIKDLEKEKDKINSVLDDAKSGSSTKEKKDEYKELFDFFERRIKNLNAALSLLKTNLDNVTGSFAKNKLIDAEIAISEEKFKNYSDALNMYTEKANEALSKLPSDIAEKVKDGAVDLTTFIGDGNKDVVEAIKDYEQWADKVADCKQELAELKTAIRQLELEKFNNIVEEFTNQFDLREDGKDLISKQIALLKEAGELIGESFFNKQIEQSKKQLELLEAEKAKLVEQMESALASGRVD